jgi:hypothetical protein
VLAELVAAERAALHLLAPAPQVVLTQAEVAAAGLRLRLRQQQAQLVVPA